MKTHYVDIDGLRIGDGYPVRTMGVINLSPESFYKGAVAVGKENIEQAVDAMESEGAEIIDIGGASTAPKSVYKRQEVTVREEIRRVGTAMKVITDRSNIPVSIDTVWSNVAEVALDLGAVLINDTSGLKADSNMVKLASSRDCSIILMANCCNPCQSVEESLEAIRTSLSVADESGVRNERIIVDPGIGFGKPPEIDCTILRELNRFIELNYPVLVGVSRKAFIGSILEQPNPSERLVGSLAATALAVFQGANIIRTHDARETKMAIKIGESIKGKGVANQKMNASDDQ